ncbi:hypothetical protein L6452_27356 [Arctium lappa]|uniref:Uncharacterized protein n=1 Tax=Arctium lappa TaxID=4217 RepID=A0ACB8ZW66_ARCLA|nr:hypothetical protein L6452_27356 [Arctium lappa]
MMLSNRSLVRVRKKNESCGRSRSHCSRHGSHFLQKSNSTIIYIKKIKTNKPINILELLSLTSLYFSWHHMVSKTPLSSLLSLHTQEKNKCVYVRFSV